MMRRQRVSLYRAVLLPLVLILVLSAFVSAAYASVPVELPGLRAAPVAPVAPAAPALEVTKTLVNPTGRTVFYTGETVSFDLVVRNTGTTTIAYLPQFDQFGTECLEFVPKASPAESDYSNVAGSIDWYDLTFVNGQDLAPGQTFTTRADFLVVGPQSGTGASGYNTVQITNARDVNNTPVPAASDTVNFTCALRPAVTLDKSIASPAGRTVFLTGEQVTFDVVVTNSGPTTLAYIPQFDQFDTACLEFLPKASPAESDSSNVAGSIEWYDLTFINGQDLPPGDSFTTQMNFLVVGPATAPTLPGTNTATVSGALDEYGSPTLDVQDTVQYTCAAPASIGDYVWGDLNGNGLQDDGPGAGLNGVTLRLYKDDGDGIFEPGADDGLVATEVTAGDGAYLFDMLHAGTYWVDVDETTLSGGLTLTSGTDPRLVTVAYGDAYLTADFGYSGADLSITKTDSPDPVRAGGNLTYALVARNNGPSSVPSVTVTDVLPAGVTFVSASPAPASGPSPLVWNLGPLAPGGTHTITVLVKVDADTRGTVYNQAEVSSPASDPNPNNNAAVEPTDVVYPAINLAKSANPAYTIGSANVVYTYVATNPGDVPLAGVTVTDDTCAPVSYTGGDTNANSLLDPGEAWQFTCATVLLGDTTNIATVTGQPSDPNGDPLPGIGPITDDATAFVDFVAPAIQIVKTANPTVIYPGESVLYTFDVTNEGDVPLGSVTVSDNHCSPVTYVSGDTDNDGLLDAASNAGPAETWVYTCTGNPTEDTVNTAETSGQPTTNDGVPLPGLPRVRDSDDAVVNVINPAIQIVKTADPAIINAGDTVVYTYAVTNPGDDPLANVTATDDKCSPLVYQGGDANTNGFLDTGETWTYTCSTTVAADTTNTATATGTDSLGTPVSDTDEAFVDVVTVGLYIEKTANPTIIYANGTVLYTYTVRNTGGNRIYDVVVTDDRCSPVLFQSSDTNNNTTLEPGETWTYTCSTTLAADTTNTATVTGRDPLGQPVTPDSAVAHVNVINPAIHVVKSVDKTIVLAGTGVVYTYVVTNPGDDPLSNVTVSDNKCGPLAFQGGDANTNGKLDPGEQWHYTCTTLIAVDTTNIVTATGTDSLGEPVQDNDSVTVDVVAPRVEVVKTADPTIVVAGQTVVYTYDVANTGDIALTSLIIADNKCAPLTYVSGDGNGNSLLDAGEVWRYTCSVPLAVDTTNTAIVSGQPSDPNGVPVPGLNPVTTQDSASVDVIHPSIDLAKVADPTVIHAGEAVLYTFTIRNTGDVPLANVTLSDDRCSPPLFVSGDVDGDGLLDLSETWTYTCAANPLVDTLNTAVVVGQPASDLGTPFPGVAPVDDTAQASVNVINPAIQVVKTANAGMVYPNTNVTYTYAVTNPGDDPLANVSVTDNLCSSPVYQGGDTDGDDLLDVDETWLYTCTMNISDDTTNTATATGDDSLGSPVSDTDDEFVDVITTGLQITKVADATTIYAGGSVLYTYTVKNTGTAPVYSVDVTDDQCSPVTYVSGDNIANGLLDPSETWIYTCATTLSRDTTNVATVTGVDPLGNPTTPDEAAVSVNVISPAIDVVKSVDRSVVLAGTQVLYTYEVRNPGNDPLANVSVTDDRCDPLLFISGDLNSDLMLDPGEVWTYQCVAAITTDTLNTVTATGDDSLGNPVRDEDQATVDVIAPALEIIKTADPLVTLPNGAVLYTFLVSNTGDTPLAPPVVTDDTCSPVSGPEAAGDTNGNVLLDAGETWTYTCVTTVANDTTNVATATAQPVDPNGQPLPGIPPVDGTDRATVDVVHPSILVVKAANPSVVYAGEQIVYTFEVYNTGDTPLAGISLTDDHCSPLVYDTGDLDGDGLLDLTETWVYRCTTNVSVDTLNTVSVTGQPTDEDGARLPGIAPVDDTDTASVDVINPRLAIVKTPDQPVVLPGTSVSYLYQVQNTGDDPLTSVTVTDDKCSPVVLLTNDGNGQLDPGEVWDFRCTTVVTQDTINTATTAGTDSLGGPVSAETTAYVEVEPSGIGVVKSASSSMVYVGDSVTYSFDVYSNSLYPLYDVMLQDDRCTPLVFQGGDADGDNVLDAGEVWHYTCTTTLTQSTTNVATVIAEDPVGQQVTDSDTVDVTVLNPAIAVTKVADPLVLLAGGQVVYTYEVTNPGADPLANVTVTDDKCDPLVFNGGDLNNDGMLDPGETWTYTCTVNPTEDTTNTVTATGDDPAGNPVEDTATAAVDVVAPGIAVAKTADPVVALAGAAVLYTFEVSNTGDVPLRGVSLTDDTCAPAQYQGGDDNGNGLLDSASNAGAGEIWVYTCATTVDADTTNTATVVGQPSDPSGQPLPGIPTVNGQDTATVDIVEPAIHIVKSANPTVIYSGGSVTYSYVVTNPGDVVLAGVAPSDDKCGPLAFTGGDTNGNGRLDPASNAGAGESWTYTCTTTLTEDTVNTVVVTGQPVNPAGQPLPNIAPVSDDDFANVTVLRPRVEIVKTASPTQGPRGTSVTYTYEVTNTGDAPLYTVTVADDKCSPVTLLTSDGNGVLDPGETWVYQCTTTLNVDTTNTATVTAKDPLNAPVTDADTAFVDIFATGLQIDKSANPTVGYPGQSVLYVYTVRGTGTDPIYNVAVSDDKCSPLTGPLPGGDANANGALDPTETWSYACSSTLTNDVTNTATVTGRDGLGNPVPPDQATATVNVLRPAIRINKVADPAVTLAGGLVVYTIEVTNPGDDPLANVTVTDNQCTSLVFDGGDLDADGLLDPGETWTYTCAANPTADVTNTATATGDDSLGKPVSDTDTAAVDVVRPELQLTKTADKTLIVAGDTVLYTYAVYNSGDVPLAGVTVVDDTCAPAQLIGGDANGNGLLDPAGNAGAGETWTFTCSTVVAADTTNTAIASGQPSDPNGEPLPGISPVSDQATAFVDTINPRINVNKTAAPDMVHSGDSVQYTYAVTNPGDVTLASVTVTDDLCTPLTFTGGDTNGNNWLEPSETWTYTCAAPITTDTLNTATAQGQPVDANGTPFPVTVTAEDEDTALADVLNPGVAVTKSGPTASFAGDTVTFTFSVVNTGDALLAVTSVVDDVCGTASYQSGDADPDGLLGLAETWIYTCVYVIKHTDPDPLVNTVTVQAHDLLNRPVSAADDWQTDRIVASFGDFVWVDDGDGVQEPGETSGLNGVPITVTGTDVLGNSVNLTVNSVGGAYLVNNLLPGTYTATAPATYSGYALSSPASITFTLTTAAPQRLDIDFGYAYPTAVQLVNFTTTADAASVTLAWEVMLTDGSEAPRFHVWRSQVGGAWKRLTIDLLDPVTSDGMKATYGYVDGFVERGKTYLYQLRNAEGEAFGPWQVKADAEPGKTFLPLVQR